MTEETNETNKTKFAEKQTETTESKVKEQPQDQIVEEQPTNEREPETVGNLQPAIEKLEGERDDYKNRLLRAQADLDNFRRRTREEKTTAAKYKAQSLVEKLLPVLDNFERALNIEAGGEETKSLLEGMEIIHRQLKDALEGENVKEIVAEGQPFDPHYHQAVMEVENEDHEANTVVEVMQKGYTLNDRVIRPAMVKVIA